MATEGKHSGKVTGLPVMREKVAGVDVGSEVHFVCGPGRADGKPKVRSFGATTGQLREMAEWLKAEGVESVAMESTGVYGVPLYELLEGEGWEVLLVNTRQLANVTGRKTDVKDCQWIQQLHSCGLLRGSFHPSEEIAQLRTLRRDKGTLVAERSDWLRRMQKSLEQMNVRVHRAVADVDGGTGMAILRAIVKGERDPKQLAQLRDPRCHQSEEKIAEQLTGHWREDHLFSLQQALKMYDAIQERIEEYEREILRVMKKLERGDCGGAVAPPPVNKEKAKAIRKRRQEGARQALYRMSGADLTTIDGIGVETAEIVYSEYGPDLSAFATEKHFVSHLLLAPRRAISGGKPLKKKRKGTASTRVSAALRMAAVALRHSQTALGAYYRQIARGKGKNVAVFATARKLAVLIYRMLRWGQAYVDEGAKAYEQRYQAGRLARLTATVEQLGYRLAPKPELAKG